MTRTLLIVNDDIDSCSFYEDYLTSKHVTYSIQIAHDATEALKLAAAFRPFVALVDRNLQKGSGTGLNLAMHLKRKFNTDCILVSSEYSPISNQARTDLAATKAKAAFNAPMRNYDALAGTIDQIMGLGAKREAQ